MEYAIAVNRTTLHTFPSDEQILDDPADPDFDYQHLTGVCVAVPFVVLGNNSLFFCVSHVTVPPVRAAVFQRNGTRTLLLIHACSQLHSLGISHV